VSTTRLFIVDNFDREMDCLDIQFSSSNIGDYYYTTGYGGAIGDSNR